MSNPFDPDGWSPWLDPDLPKMRCEEDDYDDGSYVIYDGLYMTAGLANELKRMDAHIKTSQERLDKTWEQILDNVRAMKTGGEWIETSPGVFVRR